MYFFLVLQNQTEFKLHSVDSLHRPTPPFSLNVLWVRFRIQRNWEPLLPSLSLLWETVPHAMGLPYDWNSWLGMTLELYVVLHVVKYFRSVVEMLQCPVLSSHVSHLNERTGSSVSITHHLGTRTGGVRQRKDNLLWNRWKRRGKVSTPLSWPWHSC